MRILSTGFFISPTTCLGKVLLAAVLLAALFTPCAASEILHLSTGEWKPYTSATMEGYGFFSEIVTAAFQEAGVDVVIEFYPWARCEANVKTGKTFAAFPYSVTEQRRAFARFSTPVSSSTTVLFYNSNLHKKPIVYDKLEELRPYSIIGVRGYFYSERFEKKGLRVDYVSDEGKALGLILIERYDLLPLNNYVGFNLIKEKFPQQRNHFSVCDKPLSDDTLHLMVSRRHPDARALLAAFNDALARLKQQGAYQKIVSRHFPMAATDD
jgi:polar amino acid transport system substrate-binding protein